MINKTNNPVPDDEPLLFLPLSHERFDVPKSMMMKGMNKVMKEVTFFELTGSTFIRFGSSGGFILSNSPNGSLMGRQVRSRGLLRRWSAEQ